MGRSMGTVALVLAFAALALAILPRHVLQVREERKTLSDKFNEVTEKLSAELEGKPQADPIKQYDLAAVACGFLGLALGVVGWLRNGNARVCWTAVAISCAAILWRYLVTS